MWRKLKLLIFWRWKGLRNLVSLHKLNQLKDIMSKKKIMEIRRRRKKKDKMLEMIQNSSTIYCQCLFGTSVTKKLKKLKDSVKKSKMNLMFFRKHQSNNFGFKISFNFWRFLISMKLNKKSRERKMSSLLKRMVKVKKLEGKLREKRKKRQNLTQRRDLTGIQMKNLRLILKIKRIYRKAKKQSSQSSLLSKKRNLKRRRSSRKQMIFSQEFKESWRHRIVIQANWR